MVKNKQQLLLLTLIVTIYLPKFNKSIIYDTTSSFNLNCVKNIPL